MIDLSRKYDRISAASTAVIVALLFFILMISKCSSEVDAKENPNAGGVAVSLGEPDMGGPDNSAQEMQEYTPPEVEDYIPESQVTSDVPDAPKVKKTTPQEKPPTKTTPKEETTKPQEKKDPPRKPSDRDMFGSNKTGGGEGDGSKNGQQGDPDGDPNGNPDGQGTGVGDGPGKAQGYGVSGDIRGFRASIQAPESGVQDEGLVRLYVCVDANGRVTNIRHDPERGNPLTTTNSKLVAIAKKSMQNSSFKNVSGSTGGCGYFKYNFKLN